MNTKKLDHFSVQIKLGKVPARKQGIADHRVRVVALHELIRGEVDLKIAADNANRIAMPLDLVDGPNSVRNSV